jgi:hypothetical protein
MEISLSLTTLKAGGNQNKHSLSLEPKLGRIRLRKWDNLHFRGSPKHPMTLILVERLEAITGQLKTQPLWLVWVGLQMPPLTEIWQLYLRRFTIEYVVSLAQQTLHWTLAEVEYPRTMSTMERFDAISDLAIMVS